MVLPGPEQRSDFVSILNREFELYALALPCGPNFGDARLMSTWRTSCHTGVGATFWHPSSQAYGFLAMRRRADHRFVEVGRRDGLAHHEVALEGMRAALKPKAPPELIPPGERVRARMVDLEKRIP